MSDGRIEAGSRARRRWLLFGLLVGAVTGLVASRPSLTRRLGRRLGSRFRYLGGRFRGVAYRVGGGRPIADVADDVLADRVRSTLGPLEKRVDLPRIHVGVHEHIAVLYGAVGSADGRTAIENAVTHICRVRGIESHLHEGLGRGDTRPSEGSANPPPSEARARLLAAATAAGVPADHAERAVSGVLLTLAERVPRGEWTT